MIEEKLYEIFKEISPTLKADGYNAYNDYAYVSIEQVKTLFHKLLIKHGIMFYLEVVDYSNDAVGDKGMVLTTVKCIAHFVDVEGNIDELTVQTVGQGIDNTGKGVSKAKSDAIKRLFTDIFLISSADENEEGTPPVGSETNHKTTKQTHPKYFSKTKENGQAMATESQKKYILDLLDSTKMPQEALLELFKGKDIEELSKAEAKNIISALLKYERQGA